MDGTAPAQERPECVHVFVMVTGGEGNQPSQEGITQVCP